MREAIIQARSKGFTSHNTTGIIYNIYNTSCVLTYQNFTPYLYNVEHNGMTHRKWSYTSTHC